MNRFEAARIEAAMSRALELARETLGSTAPNPPVAAAALDASGTVICEAVHAGAGLEHAEALLLRKLKEQGKESRAEFVVVTLEPCNHTGRTGPCTEALIRSKVRRVVFGSIDPNPRVKGGGEARLRDVGFEVVAGVLKEECDALISGFSKWARTGLPWVTVKRAFGPGGGMIPPAGSKTFTRTESIRLAHELRRRSDAILTGSGTVLADDPHFTVRALPDHPGKRRELVIFDRRNRVSDAWCEAARKRGFNPWKAADLEESLRELGRKGCHHVLVEAGPSLSRAVLESPFWDERIDIFSGQNADRVERHLSKA